MHAQAIAQNDKKKIAANALGICVFAAFNPLLPYTQNPVAEWLLSIASALVFALLVNWLWTKLSRQRKAPDSWKNVALIAWFFMAATVVVPYMDKAQKQKAPNVGAPALAQVEQPATKHRSQLDIAFENAPPYQPPAQ